jgi:erythromycin esterase
MVKVKASRVRHVLKHTLLCLVIVLLVSSCGDSETAQPLTPIVGMGPTLSESPTLLPSTRPLEQTTEPAVHISSALRAWLRAYAVHLNTSKPDAPFDNLHSLREIVDDARIVALGEATHGTHEFNQMRHRLFRFLVQEMGFNVFVIEASWADANRLNHYVQTGKGDPVTLLSKLGFWTVNTKEVLALVQWMRAYNADPDTTRPLRFAGVDMQHYHTAIEDVIIYLEQVDTETATQVQANFACFSRYQHWTDYAERPDIEQAACRERLQAVYDLLKRHEATYTSTSSAASFARALQAARIVLQAETLGAASSVYDSYAARDRFMAENATWLLQNTGSDSRMVLWAHNEHIAAPPVGESMGSHLRKRLDDQLVAIAFTFNRGQFIAAEREGADLVRFTVDSAPPGSMAHALNAAEISPLLLELEDSENNAADKWLTTPQKIRSIGSTYDPDQPQYYFDTVVPSLSYNAVIYFHKTTAAQVFQR